MSLLPPQPHLQESVTLIRGEEKIHYKYDMEKVRRLDDPPEINEVNIKSLSSLFLNNNPQFQTLLSALMSWNETAKNYNENLPNSFRKEHNKLTVNNLIFVNLARFLNEVIATTDRKLQLKMLGTVFDWYYSEIGKKPQPTPTMSGNFILDSSRPNTSTTYRKRGDASFETGGIRSEHANYDQPKVRLKEYGRRLPNYNDNSMSSTTALSYQKFGGGEFSRPQTSPFGTGMPNYIDMIGGGGRPRTTATGTRNDRSEEAFSVTGNTINIGDFLNRNPGYGFNSEPQGMPLRREIRSSQDQRTKPTMRTPFSNGFFEETPEERKLEEIWYRQQHKRLAEKKEDEELVGFMREWAANKGRLEEELVRKGEGDKMGSEFNEMKYEVKKTVLMQNEDADIVMQEYPEIENPEHEYVKLETGMEINKLRVMNEPAEIKGGDEIEIEYKKEAIEIAFNQQEKETERYFTPDKEKGKKKTEGKTRFFDSIQSNNTVSTAIGASVEKGGTATNQSLFQSTETLKLQKKEEEKLQNAEIDEKIKKAKEKASKFNKKRPSTEHQEKRRFIKYKMTGNDKLIGDIVDSPIIKLVKQGHKFSELEQEEKKIRIVDFSGNRIVEHQKNKSSLQNLEKEIGKQKIKEVRYHYGEYLKDFANSNNLIHDAVNKESLSVYSRPLSQQHTYRKFSNIFKPTLSKEAIRQEQINEIQEVKRRLGHWGMACSTKKLENGLLMPLMVLGEKFRVAESGCMLFENPFNRAEKKKKTKKASMVK